jgi:hypothetical protein
MSGIFGSTGSTSSTSSSLGSLGNLLAASPTLFGNSKGIDPSTAGTAFDVQQLGMSTDQAALAMHNRYSQLGIDLPSGLDASGQNLVGTTPSTMEAMDVSGIPSQSGGLNLQEAALGGQLQNSQQSNPIYNGTALNTLAQQAGFNAGASGQGTDNTGTGG